MWGLDSLLSQAKVIGSACLFELIYQKSEPYIITTLWVFQHQEMRMVLSESSSQLDHTWIILSIAILKRALPAPTPPPAAAQDVGTQTKCKQQMTS